MKTDGIFTIHKFEIPFKSYDQPIYLVPFGDVHRSAPHCHEERWLEFLAWAKKKPNCFFLGMGDYDDLVSTSERVLLSDTRFHDSTRQTLDKFFRKQTEKLAKELEFMRGKIVGIAGGNHYATLSSGISTDNLLADLLGAQYLGVCSFIRLVFINTTRKKSSSLDVFIHHGRSSGRLAGGTINSVEKMLDIAEADIYICGHDHQRGVRPLERLKLQGTDSFRLAQKKMLLARSGSFLKGYVPGEPNYIVDGAMRPSDLGVVKIELTPRREQKNKEDYQHIDIHASI